MEFGWPGREVVGVVNAGLLPVYGRGMLGSRHRPIPGRMSKLRVLAAVLCSRVRLAHGDVVVFVFVFVLVPAGVMSLCSTTRSCPIPTAIACTNAKLSVSL